MLAVVLLFVSLVLLFFRSLARKQKLKLPPGPIILPIVGNLFSVALSKKTGFYKICQDLGKTYGPIINLQFGKLHLVVFEDCEQIKEVASSEIWVDKFCNELLAERTFGKHLGILFGGGESQKEMRRFTIRTLRDFGFGKQKSMEVTIQEELQELTDFLQTSIDSKKSVVDMKHFFTISVLNILWSMVACTRFKRDDRKLHELIVLLQKYTEVNAVGEFENSPVMLFSAFPFTAKIPFLLSKQNEDRKKIEKEFCAFFKSVIDDRRASGTYREEQRDFIDVFLCKIDSNRNVSPEINHYTDEQLIVVIMDLFMAGSETTSNTLEYAILFMILNPIIQRNVQAEIDSVLGTRLPINTDMINMPYTQATILEVQRKATIVPLTQRSPTQDTKIRNYDIPKGTIGFFNLYSLHMNEKTWKNPHEFQPARFLDSNKNIINSDNILPFGFGKRKCIGEVFARGTLFTSITTVLQKFSFEQSPDHEIPTTEPDIGFTLSPKHYHALVKERTCGASLDINCN